MRSPPDSPLAGYNVYMLEKDKKRPGGGRKGGKTFPLRVACVDMGSNAIRFFAAEFASPSEFTVLADERLPVRLGAGVFVAGRLDRAAMQEAGVTGPPTVLFLDEA